MSRAVKVRFAKRSFVLGEVKKSGIEFWKFLEDVVPEVAEDPFKAVHGSKSADISRIESWFLSDFDLEEILFFWALIFAKID